MSDRNGDKAAIFDFDGFRIDTVKRLVTGADRKPLGLTAKAYETLLFLVENPGRVIERREIMDAVWPGTAVEENNLTQHIAALRRVFGENKSEHRYIVTVPGHGYKFAANVSRPVITTAENIPERTSRKLFLLLSAIIVSSLALLGFLDRIESASPENRKKRSIAVLPFKPVSDQERSQSFEMGMTDALITKLENADRLTVRSFQAVKHLASIDIDAVKAGQDLSVDVVVVPSMQIADGRVRVSVKLINVPDSKLLWNQSFDEDWKDIFRLQEILSERVATALKVRLNEVPIKHFTENPDAYQLYLDGWFHQFRLEPDEVKLGIAKFRQAIEIDQNYALAYAGIARGYMSLALSAEEPPGEMMDQAFIAAERSVAIDPELSDGHATLGALNFWFKHDWTASEANMKKALDLDPDSPFAHAYYAILLGNIGRMDEAISESEIAREIDPFWAFSTSTQGTLLVHAGRPNEALPRFAEAIKLNPRLWTAYCKAALALIDLHRFDEAIAKAKKAAELNSSQTNSLAFESYALARSGKRLEAKKILDVMLKRSARQYVPPYHIAIAFAGLGDRENALTWLERAFIERDTRLVFLRSEHFWDEYHTETRYIELKKKMHLD